MIPVEPFTAPTRIAAPATAPAPYGLDLATVTTAVSHFRWHIVDRVDRQVTHVLLDESHLWDQKRVAIPIGSVIDLCDVKDGVRVNLTKDRVRNPPLVELDVQK